MTRYEDVPIVLVSDRESFLARIAEYEHSTEVFIDIETVD